MGADGAEYVSRDRIAARESARRAEILRANKRQIAAQVLRAEIDAGRVPTGIDRGVFRAVVARLVADLEAAG
jgi:hypothetical protein